MAIIAPFVLHFTSILGSLCMCYIRTATHMHSISELKEGSVGVVFNTYIYDSYINGIDMCLFFVCGFLYFPHYWWAFRCGLRKVYLA